MAERVMNRETDEMERQEIDGAMPAGTDVVARAEALIPLLRERAAQTSAEARLPDETIADMDAAGLFSMTIPRRYGGLQTDITTYMNAVVALGRGDPSAAWVATIININNWFLSALYPPETTEEVFSTPGARTAAVLSPRSCKSRRVEGGFVIEEGIWGFNSGVYHSQWEMLGFPVIEDGVHQYDALALMPTSNVEFLDDWDTIGIRGSGSTSVRVRDIFVPDARIGRADLARQGIYPSTQLDDEWLYRSAFTPLGQIIIAFPALGAGLGALDMFMNGLAKRGIAATQYKSQAEAPVTHLQIGEASAKIDAARTIIAAAAAEIEGAAQAGRPMAPLDRARIRRDTGFADRLIWEGVDKLADASGGSFASVRHPLGRYWHDARIASLHATLVPSTVYELYGRMMCGMEPAGNV